MTNQLFRDYLDGRIVVRKRIRPGFYWIPAGSIREAPTMRDLEKAVDISKFVVTIGPAFDELAETMRRVGNAASQCHVPDYKKPTPTPPWAGNIVTQKRRRKL